MSARSVLLTFEAFHKVYYSISANKSKTTERADAVNRKRYTRRSLAKRSQMQAEITAGHGTGVQAKWNPVSQDFRVQVTSALYKQVIFDPCANGLFKRSLEIPGRAGHSWRKNGPCC